MIMFVNPFIAVIIVFMNRSVIFVTVLKSVPFGSVSRQVTIIMFFVMTSGVLIPPAVVVRRFLVSVAPVIFSADMLIPDRIMMPVFSALRPGSTCK
jgi:hypothetical protein